MTESFRRSFSPTDDSSRTVICRNDMHFVLVNRLGLSLPRKSMDRLKLEKASFNS